MVSRRKDEDKTDSVMQSCSYNELTCQGSLCALQVSTEDHWKNRTIGLESRTFLFLSVYARKISLNVICFESIDDNYVEQYFHVGQSSLHSLA